MLTVIVALALVILGLVVTFEVAFSVEQTPACTNCTAPTTLLEEDCEYLGGGWLQGHRVFVCDECLALTRREFLSGPNDFVSAA